MKLQGRAKNLTSPLQFHYHTYIKIWCARFQVMIKSDVTWESRDHGMLTAHTSRPFKRLPSFQLKMERQHFTRDELDHYREAFSLYDTHDKGYITTKELGALIRSLGQNPTESEVAEMINEVDSDKNGLLEFEEFIAIMSKRMTWESMAFEISEAFR